MYKRQLMLLAVNVSNSQILLGGYDGSRLVFCARVHADRALSLIHICPSQTARLTMSPDLIQGRRLEFQHHKCGIPRLTPQKLTPLLPSLPHILYM